MLSQSVEGLEAWALGFCAELSAPSENDMPRTLLLHHIQEATEPGGRHGKSYVEEHFARDAIQGSGGYHKLQELKGHSVAAKLKTDPGRAAAGLLGNLRTRRKATHSPGEMASSSLPVPKIVQVLLIGGTKSLLIL